MAEIDQDCCPDDWWCGDEGPFSTLPGSPPTEYDSGPYRTEAEALLRCPPGPIGLICFQEEFTLPHSVRVMFVNPTGVFTSGTVDLVNRQSNFGFDTCYGTPCEQAYGVENGFALYDPMTDDAPWDGWRFSIASYFGSGGSAYYCVWYVKFVPINFNAGDGGLGVSGGFSFVNDNPGICGNVFNTSPVCPADPGVAYCLQVQLGLTTNQVPLLDTPVKLGTIYVHSWNGVTHVEEGTVEVYFGSAT